MRILWISNSTYFSGGYGIVSRYVCHGLKKWHKVLNVGMQTIGVSVTDNLGNINLPVKDSPNVRDIILDYIKTYDINLVILLGDLYVNSWDYIPPLMKQIGMPWIAHSTVNSFPPSPYLLKNLIGASKIIVPTSWGKRSLRDHGFESEYIPHGVSENYYPMDQKDRDEIKEKFDVKDKFVYLVVAANSNVKNIAATFHAYKALLENYDDAKTKTKLFILTDPTHLVGIPGADTMDFMLLRERLGLRDNVEFIKTKPNPDNPKELLIAKEDDDKAFYLNVNFGLREKEMNKLYNMADVLVVSSSAESFCMPIIEGFATGLPVVATDYAAMKEHIVNSDAGLLAEVGKVYVHKLLTDFALVNETSLSAKMKNMWKKESERKEMSKKAIEYAKKFTWEKVVNRWKEVIDQIEDKSAIDYQGGGLGI